MVVDLQESGAEPEQIMVSAREAEVPLGELPGFLEVAGPNRLSAIEQDCADINRQLNDVQVLNDDLRGQVNGFKVAVQTLPSRAEVEQLDSDLREIVFDGFPAGWRPHPDAVMRNPKQHQHCAYVA